ncbi:hypothetical protein PMAYCL1PPCAC_00597 [Pristionchus mayeri]|uniref:Uncharacterized protein n=1 Tax=Pristionchus mayeri TaxID=1317129 RepID=A0AAN4Z2X3_9BILA|nr:hypothetical protein PMAYCL1PPCAC_00597 [Pristionchus mayeri]
MMMITFPISPMNLHMVFKKLDYDALDRISSTSRKILHFASLAKQPLRERMRELTIRQNRNGDFVIETGIHYNDKSDDFFMLVQHSSGAISKWTSKNPNETKNRFPEVVQARSTMPKQIFEGVQYLLKRFIVETSCI